MVRTHLQVVKSQWRLLLKFRKCDLRGHLFPRTFWGFYVRRSSDETFTLEKLSKLTLTIWNTPTFQVDGFGFPPILKIRLVAAANLLLGHNKVSNPRLLDTTSKKEGKLPSALIILPKFGFSQFSWKPTKIRLF